MGRLDIYNPKIDKWRCFSTIVDDWITEWMSERDYKAWIYEEYTNALKEDDIQPTKYLTPADVPLESSRYITLEELEYREIRNQRCNDRCNCNFGDLFEQCDDCYYNRNYEFYKERYKNNEEDPLNVFNNKE